MRDSGMFNHCFNHLVCPFLFSFPERPSLKRLVSSLLCVSTSTSSPIFLTLPRSFGPSLPLSLSIRPSVGISRSRNVSSCSISVSPSYQTCWTCSRSTRLVRTVGCKGEGYNCEDVAMVEVYKKKRILRNIDISRFQRLLSYRRTARMDCHRLNWVWDRDRAHHHRSGCV